MGLCPGFDFSFGFGRAAPHVSLAVLDTTYDPPMVGFRVGAVGNVSVTNEQGQTIVIPAMQVGEEFRGIVRRINQDGTTVTSPTTNIIVFLQR